MNVPRPSCRCQPGCGALVPVVDGPTHAYISSVPACWHVYGEVLALEYTDPEYAALHRLTVDAYAVQYPHNPDRRNRQSAGVHLMSLCAVLERGFDVDNATTVIGKSVHAQRRRGGTWPHLLPQSLGDRTVVDIHAAVGPQDHLQRVRLWADSAWRAYFEHHATVRAWLDAA